MLINKKMMNRNQKSGSGTMTVRTALGRGFFSLVCKLQLLFFLLIDYFLRERRGLVGGFEVRAKTEILGVLVMVLVWALELLGQQIT